MEETPVILLVEDNPADVILTERALRKSNVCCELVVARDGQQALHYLFGLGQYAGRDPQRRPALILLDLKLPKVDGLEVLRLVRADERTRYLPVELTSSREEQDILRSYHLGANSYIRKPVDFDQFVEAARELGVYWLMLNEPPSLTRPGQHQKDSLFFLRFRLQGETFLPRSGRVRSAEF